MQTSAEPGTTLSWEVADTPDWGTWAFTPDYGTINATEPVTITVTAIAPYLQNHHYVGHITIINPQDPSDNCLVHISLTTPQAHQYFTAWFPRLAALLHRFLQLF